MLFVAFWIWQSPGNLQKLSSAEVDAYLHRMEGNLPGDPAEQAKFLTRMRAFGLADDGRPVYMLNAMRYYPELKRGTGMEGVPARLRSKRDLREGRDADPVPPWCISAVRRRADGDTRERQGTQ